MAPWDKFIKYFAASQGVNVTEDQKKALKHILGTFSLDFLF